MAERYALNSSQVAALRALSEGIVERSALEIAVSAGLLPKQALAALFALEKLGLASSWHPVTGRTGEHLFALNDEGQTIYRALASFEGTPPVGSVVHLRRKFPSFSGWPSSSQPASYVEIVPEQLETTLAV